MRSMGANGPANLDELRAIPDPTQRAKAAQDYITAREAALAEARRVRDEAIAALLESSGPTAVAEAVGMSLAHVRNIKTFRVRPR